MDNEHLHRDIEENRRKLEDHILMDREFHENVLRRLDDLDKRLDPIVDVYRAILFNKSFLLGVGSVIGALTLIGSAFYWLWHQR